MAQIFNGRVYNSSPYPSAEINYEYTRDGANMKYHFWGRVYLESSGGWYYNNLRLKLYLNGSNVYTKDCKSSSKGWSIDWDAGWHTVSNKTSGTTPFYFSVKDTQNSGWCNYTSGTYQLDVAPAYFSSDPTISLSSRTETSATFNWSTPETCSRVQYKIDNGSWWVEVTMDANSKSGSFTITGLSANTNYRIYGDFMRRDSGLWAINKPYQDISTYDYPHLTSISNFKITDSYINCNLYNPLGRQVKIELYGDNGSLIQYAWRNSNGSVSIVQENADRDLQYQSIPTKRSGSFRSQVVYPDVITYRYQNNGSDIYKTYSIYGNENPTFTSNNIINIHDTLNVDITGNSSKFIKGYNHLVGTITPMSTNYYATLDKYSITSSEKTTLSKSYSTSNITFEFDNIVSNVINITASDKRSCSTTVIKNIEIIDYNKPNITYNRITRQNGIGTKAIIEFRGTYTDWSNLNIPNTIKSIKYRIGSSGNFIDLPNDAEITYNNGIWTLNAILPEDFAVTSRYSIYLSITDELDTSISNEYIISTADAFIWKDLANKRMGINKKPTEALDVHGNIKSDGNVEGINIKGNALDVHGNIKSDGNVEGINIKGNALYINGVKMIWYE